MMDGITIQWAQNPLFTKVILDERAKQEFRLRLALDHLLSLLYSTALRLDEEKHPDLYDPSRALQQLKLLYDDADDEVRSLVEAAAADSYIQELQAPHVGDCTAVASSCSKCRAESIIGLDTIKGLGKHEASHIFHAFGGHRNTRSIDEALEHLKNYRPVRAGSWLKLPLADFDKHAPRWTQEARSAYAWLKQYQLDHFGG